MLSRNLEQTLHRALGLANERRHEYATLEHLLLALTDDQDAATVLRACGVDLEKLKRDLTEFLDKDLAKAVPATFSTWVASWSSSRETSSSSGQATSRWTRVRVISWDSLSSAPAPVS